MKSEFLRELGITDQTVIDKIMKENGLDVKAEKDKTQAATEQLTGLQTQLKAFDGVDVAELKNKVKTLTDDLSNKDKEYQGKLADIEFGRVLEAAVTGAKPRNAKAVMALLPMDSLKASKNQQADIAAAIEAVKKENDYLFDAGQQQQQPQFRPSGRTPGPEGPPQGKDGNAKINDALRGAYGRQGG